MYKCCAIHNCHLCDFRDCFIHQCRMSFHHYLGTEDKHCLFSLLISQKFNVIFVNLVVFTVVFDYYNVGYASAEMSISKVIYSFVIKRIQYYPLIALRIFHEIKFLLLKYCTYLLSNGFVSYERRKVEGSQKNRRWKSSTGKK